MDVSVCKGGGGGEREREKKRERERAGETVSAAAIHSKVYIFTYPTLTLLHSCLNTNYVTAFI